MTKDCTEIEPKLADAVAGRLANRENETTQKHLLSCGDCHRSFLQFQRLRSDLRQPIGPAPEWLRTNILYAVGRRKESQYSIGTFPLAFACAIVCTVLFAGVWLTDKPIFMSNKNPVRFVGVQTSHLKESFEIKGPAATLGIARHVLPKYPEEARRAKLTGYVEIYFMTDPEGSVNPNLRVTKSSGHTVLDQSAKEAMLQWKFIPRTPRTSEWGLISFKFPSSI